MTVWCPTCGTKFDIMLPFKFLKVTTTTHCPNCSTVFTVDLKFGRGKKAGPSETK